jgi:hypothetical protein
MFRKLVGSFSAVLLLAGCSAPTDSFVQVVEDAVTETSFQATGQMASGCIGVYLYCAQPMYEPIFYAPESVEPAVACTDLISITDRLGLKAYATTGSMAWAVPEDNAELLKFCSEALGRSLTNTDGSMIYNGLAFYDDGSSDGFGKIYSINRGPTEFGDGYTLIISFSRDLGRIGPIPYGSEKPKLMTQADLDKANQQTEIAAETMKVANQLLGKPEAQAIETIEVNGYSWVIIDRDGVEQEFDQTYDPRRILLTIRDGAIYDAIAG